MIFYIIFLACSAVQATSYKLADSFVGATPDTVQEVNTRLSLRITPVSAIPQGSLVELQLPDSGVVFFSENVFTGGG